MGPGCSVVGFGNQEMDRLSEYVTRTSKWDVERLKTTTRLKDCTVRMD
jgi:hypothetical protein